jgi:ABC-type ATPase with predicted acetyltransferase domain
MQAMNRNIWLLQRVVLHPSYRGAGMASAFIRRACELCPVPFVETLSAMARVNPVFEKAGFTRVGTVPGKRSGPKPVYLMWRRP